MRGWLVAAFAAFISFAAFGSESLVTADGVVHGKGFIPGHQVEQARYWAPDALGDEQLPESFDSRELGYVAPIKDQGQCGSCWDFSMTKTLESARLSAGQGYVDLAEQDPLVNDRGAYGCQGGFMDASYWMTPGLTGEKSCPYKANDGYACGGKPVEHGYKWGFVGAKGRAPTVAELRAAVVKYHVISVTVAAGGSDWSYAPNGAMTDCSNTGIDHMVNIVGYKPAKSGGYVFIGANSWGTQWGDKGFFYAKQGCDQLASTADSALWITYDK